MASDEEAKKKEVSDLEVMTADGAMDTETESQRGSTEFESDDATQSEDDDDESD